MLFVIGLCAIFAGDELPLTWWPLFRDCVYYLFGLTILTVFCYDKKVGSFHESVDIKFPPHKADFSARARLPRGSLLLLS